MQAVSMQKSSPIHVSMDLNEAHRARGRKIKAAVIRDHHFLLDNPMDRPFDISFQWEGRIVDVELKDFTGEGWAQSDYVSSIVNQNGHLYQQILAGLELQDPLIVVVLGDDADVAKAIDDMFNNRGIEGQEAEDKITKYTFMVEQFEANCIGMNIQVFAAQDRSMEADAPQYQEASARRKSDRLSTEAGI